MTLQDRKKLLEVANALDEMYKQVILYKDYDMHISHLTRFATIIRTIAQKP